MSLVASTLTVADVADDLRLARSTAADYLRTGRIPGGFQAVERGRWLVDAAAYGAWKEARRTAADPHRIEPRSARSRAAQTRRKAS